MSNLALLVVHVRSANRAFWRNPASAFFTLGMPVMFLVLFSVLFGNEKATIDGHQVSSATFTLSGIIAFSVIGACFTNLAIGVTFAREGGFLKRLRGTPLPPWVYLTARMIHSVLVAGLLVGVSVAFSALFYGVRVSWGSVPALIVSLSVGAACFSCLGLAVTAIIPNADASPAVVNAVVLPLLFVSNVFIPIDRPPLCSGPSPASSRSGASRPPCTRRSSPGPTAPACPLINSPSWLPGAPPDSSWRCGSSPGNRASSRDEARRWR
jgi:ABC-2 type transport system permease protein